MPAARPRHDVVLGTGAAGRELSGDAGWFELREPPRAGAAVAGLFRPRVGSIRLRTVGRHWTGIGCGTCVGRTLGDGSGSGLIGTLATQSVDRRDWVFTRLLQPLGVSRLVIPAKAGRPRLASVRQRQVVDTGLRRHDEAGDARGSIFRAPAIIRSTGVVGLTIQPIASSAVDHFLDPGCERIQLKGLGQELRIILDRRGSTPGRGA